MTKYKDIPVHKIKNRNPQTGEMGWTFRVNTGGTLDVEYVAEHMGRSLLIEPRMAAMIFDMIGREILYRIQMGFTVNLGALGYLHPKILNPGWAKREEDMNLHGTSGFLSWEPSKRTKAAFRDVGCTLDSYQRRRNRQKGIKDDDDDDNWDDGYPLELKDED